MSRPPCRVLLVDDDDLVRRVGTRSLRRRLGVEVIGASDGNEALARWRESPDTIDVVVLDLDMPGMDGVEVLHRLEQLAPGVPVIIWSGRNLSPPPSELAAAMALVSKDADIGVLVDAVDRAMGSGRRRSGSRRRLKAIPMPETQKQASED